MSSRLSFTMLASAVLVAVAPGISAQTAVTGCFDVDVTGWQPAMPRDSIQFVPPTRVRFDSKADSAGRTAVYTAPGALGSAHPQAFAIVNDNAIVVTWTNGYYGSRVALRKDKSGWAGPLRTFVDYQTNLEYSATVRLTAVRCDAPLSAARRDHERYSGRIRFASGQVTVGSKLGRAPLRLVTKGKYVATERPIGAFATADTTHITTGPSGNVRFVRMAIGPKTTFDQQLKRMSAYLGKPTSQATTPTNDGAATSASWASRTLLISLVSVASASKHEMYVLMSDPQLR